jgi:hypothetical protein
MSHTMPWNCGPCYIYGLVDPRTGSIFYVGVSWFPKKRLSNHRCDPASSAYHTVREIFSSGLEVGIDILETHETRFEAEKREQIFISVLPGLINQDRKLKA